MMNRQEKLAKKRGLESRTQNDLFSFDTRRDGIMERQRSINALGVANFFANNIQNSLHQTVVNQENQSLNQVNQIPIVAAGLGDEAFENKRGRLHSNVSMSDGSQNPLTNSLRTSLLSGPSVFGNSNTNPFHGGNGTFLGNTITEIPRDSNNGDSSNSGAFNNGDDSVNDEEKNDQNLVDNAITIADAITRQSSNQTVNNSTGINSTGIVDGIRSSGKAPPGGVFQPNQVTTVFQSRPNKRSRSDDEDSESNKKGRIEWIPPHNLEGWGREFILAFRGVEGNEHEQSRRVQQLLQEHEKQVVSRHESDIKTRYLDVNDRYEKLKGANQILYRAVAQMNGRLRKSGSSPTNPNQNPNQDPNGRNGLNGGATNPITGVVKNETSGNSSGSSCPSAASAGLSSNGLTLASKNSSLGNVSSSNAFQPASSSSSAFAQQSLSQFPPFPAPITEGTSIPVNRNENNGQNSGGMLAHTGSLSEDDAIMCGSPSSEDDRFTTLKRKIEQLEAQNKKLEQHNGFLQYHLSLKG